MKFWSFLGAMLPRLLAQGCLVFTPSPSGSGASTFETQGRGPGHDKHSENAAGAAVVRAVTLLCSGLSECVWANVPPFLKNMFLAKMHAPLQMKQKKEN